MSARLVLGSGVNGMCPHATSNFLTPHKFNWTFEFADAGFVAGVDNYHRRSNRIMHRYRSSKATNIIRRRTFGEDIIALESYFPHKTDIKATHGIRKTGKK